MAVFQLFLTGTLTTDKRLEPSDRSVAEIVHLLLKLFLNRLIYLLLGYMERYCNHAINTDFYGL